MTNSEARKRMQAQNPAESAPSIDGSPEPASVDPATIPGPQTANLGLCARCGTDDDACCITIGGGGPHCCAECRNTAGRSHPKPEGVGTGAGEGAPRQDTGSAWVTRSADCPEAPAQAHPLDSNANLGDGANGHIMRWTYEDGCAKAEAVCLAAPDADCRLEPVDHGECQCEHWGRIERRDDGTIWHALTDGHRDLTLPGDEDQWHQVKPSEMPAGSGCNIALFINESGCAEELTPDGERHEFVIADVPFEPVWENDGCSWRPKPNRLAEIVREHTERALAEVASIVASRREAFLPSPNLDPAWIAGWHAAVDDVTNSVRAARQEQNR